MEEEEEEGVLETDEWSSRHSGSAEEGDVENILDHDERSVSTATASRSGSNQTRSVSDELDARSADGSSFSNSSADSVRFYSNFLCKFHGRVRVVPNACMHTR